MNLERLEDLILLIVATAFFVLSAGVLGGFVLGLPNFGLPATIGFSIASFIFGVICLEISPRNRGRLLKDMMSHMDKPLSPEDFGSLQKHVGGAGFFNRIGVAGTPLAVALPAVLLCSLVFLAEMLGYQQVSQGFLDLTKLTIGAFIGTLARSMKEG